MTQQVGGFLSNLFGGGSGGGIDVSGLPVLNSGGGNSISDIFGSNLSNYLGGGGGSSSATSGLLGDSFNITDMFDYGGTPTTGGGTFFGSGSGTGYDFGSTFDPYDTSSYIGGGGLLDYGSGNAFTMPSGGG